MLTLNSYLLTSPWHPQIISSSRNPSKPKSNSPKNTSVLVSNSSNTIPESNNPSKQQSQAGRIKRLVLNPESRAKLNPISDREFYAYPRLVTHVDERFISTLTDLYRERLRPGSEILDLMSSWVSHLPDEVEFKRVVGHGLNAQELAKNRRLDYFFVKDLNQDQKLELESCSLDAVVCTVSVQYLQQPEQKMVKSKTSKKSGEQDITWEHCTAIPGKDRGNVKCIYCGKEMTGGVYRMKHHLAGLGSDVKECKQISQDVRDMFVQLLTNKQVKNAANDCFNESTFEEDIAKGKGGMDKFVTRGKSDGQQLTINQMVKQREPVIRDICRFLYGHALAFNTVKGPLFIKMLKSVGEYGRGLKPPTYHEARVTYLKKEVEHVKGDLEVYKREWEKTGCTLMSDGWTDGKHRHLTNFLVNSPRGTVFLKSVDTSGIIKDSEALFKLLDGLVEEIGADNVVQVITDSASAYVGAGKMLEEKRPSLFWSPCAAHCLNLILSDIGDLPVFMDTIEKAKKVSSFIYRHPWLLDLFRKYTKKKELARPGVTRFATSFLTLKSMQDKKIQLRAMFASEEWAKSKYAPTQQGKEVQDILLQDARFWKAVVFCLHCAWPLVKVLRLVDGDSKPAMGYIYEAMDRAKEEVASNLKNETRRYEQIWNIIDARWDMQLHRPLHAAGFYLNPRYFYDPKYNVDREIKRGFCKVVDKMFPGLDSRVLIDEQMEKFKNAEGLFGESMAVLTRDKKQPGLWWESYGDDCNELRKLAMRVLNLTCSATGCERNWSTFDLIHSKRRNRLEQERLDALVFVKYNIQLELRQLKRQERGETYDPICLSDMESDDEWITEKEGPCLPIDHSWMDIQECFDVDEGVTSKKRKRGPRNLNAVKAKKSKEAKGKGKSMLIDEEEVEYISDDDEDEEEEEFPEMLLVDDDEDNEEFDPYDN